MSSVDMSSVEWVGQEHANGCALATVAMLTGHGYDRVQAEVDSWLAEPHSWDESGTSHYTIDRYLCAEGFWIMRKYAAWFGDDWQPKPFAPIHYASVIQPSNRGHFVVVMGDGGVLDPMRRGIYRLSDWQGVNQIVGVAKVRRGSLHGREPQRPLIGASQLAWDIYANELEAEIERLRIREAA